LIPITGQADRVNERIRISHRLWGSPKGATKGAQKRPSCDRLNDISGGVWVAIQCRHTPQQPLKCETPVVKSGRLVRVSEGVLLCPQHRPWGVSEESVTFEGWTWPAGPESP
jgi:hypothetical protein